MTLEISLNMEVEQDDDGYFVPRIYSTFKSKGSWETDVLAAHPSCETEEEAMNVGEDMMTALDEAIMDLNLSTYVVKEAVDETV